MTNSFQLTVSSGSRGAVIKQEFNADANDPWPRALQVISHRVKKGDGQLSSLDPELTITLKPVTNEGPTDPDSTDSGN